MKRALLAAVFACGTPPAPPPNNTTHMTDSSTQPTVTARSDSEWLVEVKHTIGVRSASAAVVITTAPTHEVPAPHASVASAAAWLELARASLKVGAVTDAITAARNGIDALGADYRPPKVKDDTTLELAIADEHISGGAQKDGANELISVLDQRVSLYFMRYTAVHPST